MQSNNMKELISRNIFVKIGYRDCIDFTEFFGENSHISSVENEQFTL